MNEQYSTPIQTQTPISEEQIWKMRFTRPEPPFTPIPTDNPFKTSINDKLPESVSVANTEKVANEPAKNNAVKQAAIKAIMANNDYTDNRYQYLMAQRNPYAATGMAFAEMMNNPFKNRDMRQTDLINGINDAQNKQAMLDREDARFQDLKDYRDKEFELRKKLLEQKEQENQLLRTEYLPKLDIDTSVLDDSNMSAVDKAEINNLLLANNKDLSFDLLKDKLGYMHAKNNRDKAQNRINELLGRARYNVDLLKNYNPQKIAEDRRRELLSKNTNSIADLRDQLKELSDIDERQDLLKRGNRFAISNKVRDFFNTMGMKEGAANRYNNRARFVDNFNKMNEGIEEINGILSWNDLARIAASPTSNNRLKNSINNAIKYMQQNGIEVIESKGVGEANKGAHHYFFLDSNGNEIPLNSNPELEAIAKALTGNITEFGKQTNYNG